MLIIILQDKLLKLGCGNAFNEKKTKKERKKTLHIWIKFQRKLKLKDARGYIPRTYDDSTNQNDNGTIVAWYVMIIPYQIYKLRI